MADAVVGVLARTEYGIGLFKTDAGYAARRYDRIGASPKTAPGWISNLYVGVPWGSIDYGAQSIRVCDAHDPLVC